MIDQIGVVALGVSAFFCLGFKDAKVRRWGYLLALASEVFWVWTCIVHGQWLILATVPFYVAAFGWGAVNHWIIKKGI